jgi:hypothetical protein
MEQFTVRTVGGPNPGTYVTNDIVLGWPLPDILVVDEKNEAGGHYQKVSESQMPPMSETDHVIRGAQYEWVEDEPPVNLGTQDDWVVGSEIEDP